MNNKQIIWVIILVILLFIVLPFPVFFFIMIVGGGVAGWVYQGNKTQHQQMEADAEADEFYEDAFEQLYQQEKEGREGDPITALNGNTIYAKDMTLDEWKYYQEWKEYRVWKDKQSGS